jgi:hypothetical protein
MASLSCFCFFALFRLEGDRDVGLSPVLLAKRREALFESGVQNLLPKVFTRNVLVQLPVLLDVVEDSNFHSSVMNRLFGGLVPNEANGLERFQGLPFDVTVGQSVVGLDTKHPPEMCTQRMLEKKSQIEAVAQTDPRAYLNG